MEKCGSLGELLCLGEQMKGGHSAKISPLEGELRDWSSMGESVCAIVCMCVCVCHMLIPSISVSDACIDTSQALCSRGKLLLTGPCKLSQPFRKRLPPTILSQAFIAQGKIYIF